MPNAWVTCFLLFALLASTACTRTVSSGSYGPFEIGEHKESAYEKVKALNIGYVTPRHRDTIQIKDPTLTSLRKLDAHNGILVWVDGEPVPTRIEFDGDQVVRKWPELPINEHTPRSVQENAAIVSRLRTAIPSGSSREHVYGAIVELAANHDVIVGHFVVGEHEFWINPALRWNEDYRALLLEADVWEFQGLKELVWYSAFYSRVELIFEDGHLRRIKHWAFPFELL